jgi:Mrp family chromosome partitioning ATPase
MITVTEQFVPPRLIDPRIAPIADQYQALVHRFLPLDESKGSQLRSIGVTSSGSAEGVSTVAAEMALTAASLSPQRVLLLDMNTTDAGRAGTLRAWRQLGIYDAATATDSDSSGIVPSRYENLSLLSCRDAEQLKPLPFDRPRMTQLLRDLNDEYGLVIVDLPPATDSSLALAMAGLLAGVVLVVEAEQTRFESAQRATKSLQQAQANLLGVILNKRPQHIPEWLYDRL